MPMIKQESSQKLLLQHAAKIICRHETGAHDTPHDQEIAANNDVQTSCRATLWPLAVAVSPLDAFSVARWDMSPQEYHAAM